MRGTTSSPAGYTPEGPSNKGLTSSRGRMFRQLSEEIRDFAGPHPSPLGSHLRTQTRTHPLTFSSEKSEITTGRRRQMADGGWQKATTASSFSAIRHLPSAFCFQLSPHFTAPRGGGRRGPP